jgi:hypothetical protein
LLSPPPTLTSRASEPERRRLVRLVEAAASLSSAPKHLHTLIARGQIATVRQGRRRYVKSEELDRYVDELQA